MGIIEIQVRKDRFVDFFQAELNRQRLAKPTLDVPLLPELQGRLLERIECVGCAVEPSMGAGQVTVQADMVFHYHTSLATVRAAGSLRPPVTEHVQKTLPFVFSVPLSTPSGQPSPPRFQWSMFSGLVTDDIPLDLPTEITAQSAAVEADENVVVIRLGTQVNDPVTAPIVNRLGQGDWVRLISGDVLAEVFTASLTTTLGGGLPQDVVVDTPPAGGWVAHRIGLTPWEPPFVMVGAKLVAEDQCLFDIDIGIDLQMIVGFQASGHELTTTLRLQWDADSTLCDIVSGLLLTPIAGTVVHIMAEEEVAEGILGAATNPDGFQKIAEDDESITYQSTTSVDLQAPGFVLTHSEVTNEGLVAGGTLEIQRERRGLEGEASAPASILKTDCTARRVSVAFNPATVSLRDIGVGGPPALFPGGATFDPPDAWVVALGTGNSWLDLVLVFADPSQGRQPAGTATSVFLHTDCGLRWVDLGVVPADRPEPTTTDVAEMINRCIMLVDPWGEGVLNLEWLGDPPDLLDGLTPLRQWAVGLQELPADVRVEVVAVGPEGERSLGTIEGQQNVALQLVTNANETLSLRASGPISAPAPTVSQGWITPIAEVPLESGPVSVASGGGMIAYLGDDGEIRFIDPSLSRVAGTPRTSVVSRDTPADRLAGVLGRKPGRNFDGNAVVARVDRNTVAVIHNGSLHIAHAGPMSRL
jgi:hypothetical protein